MKSHRSSKQNQTMSRALHSSLQGVLLLSFLGGQALVGSLMGCESSGDDSLEAEMDSDEVRTLFCKGKKHGDRGTIESLSLYDAETGERIRYLENGDVISLSQDGPQLSIVADVSGKVESVVFSLDDDETTKIENSFPYAIAGDQGIENLIPWDAPLGAHRLTVSAYDKDQEKERKKKGKSKSVDEISIYFSVMEGDNYLQGDAIFMSAYSEKVMGIKGKGRSKKNGDVAQCIEDGGQDQRWEIHEFLPGAFEIVNEYNGECLDGGKKSKHKGSKVETKTCTGEERQLWRIKPAGGNYFNIINANSGRCLEVTSYWWKKDAKVELGACDGDPKQLWNVPEFDLSAKDDGGENTDGGEGTNGGEDNDDDGDYSNGDDDDDANGDDDDQGGNNETNGDDDVDGDDDANGDDDYSNGDDDGDANGDDDTGGNDDQNGDDDQAGDDGGNGDDDQAGGNGLWSGADDLEGDDEA